MSKCYAFNSVQAEDRRTLVSVAVCRAVCGPSTPEATMVMI